MNVKYRQQKCSVDGTAMGPGGFNYANYLASQKYLSLLNWHPVTVNLHAEG